MKKIYLFGLALVAYAGAYGQSMSENFDSHSVGEYMGVVSPDFTTWSGTVGAAEDVQVTDGEAASGSNSIYFSTTLEAGGPQDVLIPFAGEHNTGTFLFESNFYIEDNKGAYFNFQGTDDPGESYSMNCQMVDDGRLLLDAGNSPIIETTYPSETWFNLKVSINLNTNDWELLIDDVSQGVFTNASNNQVASVNLYPVNSAAGGNNQAGYYIDDVAYNHVVYTLPERNVAVTEIKSTKGLATASVSPTAVVRNLGTTAITSFDLTITYDGGSIDESVTGVSIASLASYEVDFADYLILAAGENDMVATVSNVNGMGADDDNTDDVKTATLNPVVPAPGKIVVGEEGTGTWCGWCPRGAVFLGQMDQDYGEHFIGVAVHNGASDPMTNVPYDAALGDYIGGYPSLIVDRGADIDPSAVEADFLERVVIAPKAVLTLGSDYTDGATNMHVSVTAEFTEAISGDYRLALIVIEDHVTGTASGYNQRNYYAGGTSVMGGYELLPDPVPAANMVYDHVARAILPTFDGFPGSFPADVEAGEEHTVGFIVEINPDWDLDEVHLVGILVDTDAKIDNAGISSMDEAAANGYSSIEEGLTVGSSINLFPNPTKDLTTIDLGMVDNQNVRVEVYDMNGKLVANRDYGVLNGSYALPLSLSNLESGMYNVRLYKGNQLEQKKLIIE